MAKLIGLFTREDIRAERPTVGATARLTPEAAYEMGPKCLSINKLAKSPNMPPSGAEHPDFYILGEAPGETEDELNKQFVGKSGKLLRAQLPNRFTYRFDNCCRTRPPKNRTPKPFEVAAFKRDVEQEIARCKPKAIIGTGHVPLKWAVPQLKGESATMSCCRGRRFPVNVNGHRCWYYSVYHPAFVLRMQRPDRSFKDEFTKLFEKDMLNIWRTYTDPLPDVWDEEWDEGIEVLTDSGKIIKALTKLRSAKLIAADLETTHLRPYSTGAAILSIALSDGECTYSFLLNHPRKPWSARDKELIDAHLSDLLMSGIPFVFHNTRFDLEWLAYTYGEEICYAKDWHDTLSQAYVLDERKGGHSLNFCCLHQFGLALKQQSDVDRKNLKEARVDELLRYNALDTKYTYYLYKVQKEQIDEQEGLGDAYAEQHRRIPTLVISQLKGLPVDQEVVAEFSAEYQGTIEQLVAEIKALPSVKKFSERYGEFNPGSFPQVGKLLHEFKGRSEVVTGTNKYNTGEAILKTLRLPEADMVLAYRKAVKAKSTYVDPLDARLPTSQVHPDGCIHTSFNTTFTETGRLSSNDPNVQNYPKRNPRTKRLRKAIIPSPSCTLVAIDYGQLEARGIAMCSADPALCDIAWSDPVGFDIHLEWAEALAEAYPDTMMTRHGAIEDPKKRMKAWRGDVKNQFVFPLFYGASLPSAAGYLEMPEQLLKPVYDKFWQKHKRTRDWQQEQVRMYNQLGYVACPTGRRRHAPMTKNEVINTPIQGGCSDIVVDGMNRLKDAARELGKPWIHPVLNIHDDLTFDIPDDEVEDALEIIVPIMLDTSFPWAKTVPLLVEVSLGKNWYEMEDVAKFHSIEIIGHERPE
jgi:uracil-DNA glycosylase family 4